MTVLNEKKMTALEPSSKAMTLKAGHCRTAAK